MMAATLDAFGDEIAAATPLGRIGDRTTWPWFGVNRLLAVGPSVETADLRPHGETERRRGITGSSP